jgi:hypothetical protein
MSRMGTTTDGVGTQKTSGITNRSAREKTEQPAAKKKTAGSKTSRDTVSRGNQDSSSGKHKAWGEQVELIWFVHTAKRTQKNMQRKVLDEQFEEPSRKIKRQLDRGLPCRNHWCKTRNGHVNQSRKNAIQHRKQDQEKPNPSAASAPESNEDTTRNPTERERVKQGHRHGPRCKPDYS